MLVLMLRWGPALACAGLIFILSDRPLNVPSVVGRFDWLAHFLAFGFLATTLCWGVSDRARQPVSAGVLAAVFSLCVGYGVLDEWHQSFVPGRDSSAGDIVADAAGALALTVASGWVLKRRNRRRRQG